MTTLQIVLLVIAAIALLPLAVFLFRLIFVLSSALMMWLTAKSAYYVLLAAQWVRERRRKAGTRVR